MSGSLALERERQPHALTNEPERARSSCEIKTSTRGTDISVKCYEGSPLGPACDEALYEYFRTFDRVAQELLGRGARQ